MSRNCFYISVCFQIKEDIMLIIALHVLLGRHLLPLDYSFKYQTFGEPFIIGLKSCSCNNIHYKNRNNFYIPLPTEIIISDEKSK